MPELPEMEIVARRLDAALRGETIESALAPGVAVLKTPDPPPLAELLDFKRPLHSLMRDQQVIAGIGRTWVDDILHAARLSPFKRGDDLDAEEADALREAVVGELGRVIEHYEA